MHTGLYGAVSNFWDAVLEKNGADGQLSQYAIPYAKRKQMALRGRRFQLPAEFGRTYRQFSIDIESRHMHIKIRKASFFPTLNE